MHLAHAPRRASDFTRIELLAVLIIMAVLIALLLPALQSAREATASTGVPRRRCRRRIRSISEVHGAISDPSRSV